MSNTATPTQTTPIRVFWTNHGYYSQEEFSTLTEAITYVRSKYFEATFLQDDEVIAAWTIFGGLREYR